MTRRLRLAILLILHACAFTLLLGLGNSAGAADNNVDWPSYGGNSSDTHFSTLGQINAETINNLGLAWYFDIDTRPSSYTAPVAANGVLYFGAGFSVIHAVDVRTGKLLWKYDPHAPRLAGEKMRSAWGIRGIAYDDGRVFTGTVDGRLIALDAKTGKLLWSVRTLDRNDGRYITGAPWVFRGKVAIGHGGADFAPVRGYVTAYNAKTGRKIWRFYTVPGNPAKGFENPAMAMAAKTWKGEWWKFGGGGTVWNAMAYDARLNRLYVGTGNGAPWNQKIRSPGGGDNLFLCSIIALDADTGAYIWHYQVNPGESWDYNAAMDIELADLTIDGRNRPVILHAPKNGFFYVIDREDGRLISAEKFASRITWATSINKASGRPVEIAAARFPNGQPYVLFPSPVGAHAAEAMSYSPLTGLTYIPAIEQGRVYVDPEIGIDKWKFLPGQFINNGIGKPPSSIEVPAGSNSLLAWNPVSQSPAWSVPLPGAKNGGLLSTAGNLVFQGMGTGQLVAYTADKGSKVWSFDAQSGIMAQPISYQVDGIQYLTVITSWRAGSLMSGFPVWDYYAQHRRVLTFALGGKTTLPSPDVSPIPVVDDPTFELDETQVHKGAEIFATRCALCHGGAAKSGGMAPDLRKASAPLDSHAFSQVVRHGALIDNGMPRFPELGPDQIESLRQYIRDRARSALPQPAIR